MTITQDALEARILDIVDEVSPMPREAISLEGDFASLRLDSVASMELVGMICDEFEIDVEIEEAFGISTVREAVDLTRRHIDARVTAEA